jgi:hypothetical protein
MILNIVHVGKSHYSSSHLPSTHCVTALEQQQQQQQLAAWKVDLTLQPLRHTVTAGLPAAAPDAFMLLLLPIQIIALGL